MQARYLPQHLQGIHCKHWTQIKQHETSQAGSLRNCKLLVNDMAGGPRYSTASKTHLGVWLIATRCKAGLIDLGDAIRCKAGLVDMGDHTLSPSFCGVLTYTDIHSKSTSWICPSCALAGDWMLLKHQALGAAVVAIWCSGKSDYSSSSFHDEACLSVQQVLLGVPAACAPDLCAAASASAETPSALDEHNSSGTKQRRDFRAGISAEEVRTM